MRCESHALSAERVGDISSAHEEAVDGVGGFAGGGVEEPDIAGGVGGEGREKSVEVEVEGAVLSECFVACAAYVVEHRC